MVIIDKINIIQQLEKDIANLYSHLYELELLGDKEFKIYLKYSDELRVKLNEENELFSSLSIEEIREIYNCFRNIHVSDIKDQNILFSVCSRLSNCSYNKSLDSIYGDIDDIEILNEIKERERIRKIIFNEYNDAYLIFLDEYIGNVFDEKIKKELLNDKYTFAYIERMNVNKEKSNDIQIDTNDIDKYISIKNNFCLSGVVECIKVLISDLYDDVNNNYIDKINIINIFNKIRTYAYLMDDITFDNFISEYLNSGRISSILNKALGIDIIDVLKKDRERNKTLLLNK